MECPCPKCTKHRDFINCENKTCKEWKEWFISRWETMRYYLKMSYKKEN